MAFETAGCDMPSSNAAATVVRARVALRKRVQAAGYSCGAELLLQIRTGAILRKNCPYPGFPMTEPSSAITSPRSITISGQPRIARSTYGL